MAGDDSRALCIPTRGISATPKQDYNGITVRVQSPAGPLWVSVAAVSDADARPTES